MRAVTLSVDEWIKLMQVAIWPVTILAIVLVFRPEIPRLVEGLGRRVSKVSLASVSLELAVAREVAPEIWQSLGELKDPISAPKIGDSGQSLFRLLKGGERADFAIIDLGRGDQWLTSRLFIFALIPFQVLSLRAIVFTETRDGIGGRFVGLANPGTVRAVLGRRYGWFEGAWVALQINAYAADTEAVAEFRKSLQPLCASIDQLPLYHLNELTRSVIDSTFKPGDLSDAASAESFATQLMSSPLLSREVAATDPQKDGWLRLGPSKLAPAFVREERAGWIESGAHLEKILRGSLVHAYVVESAGISRRELYRQAVLQDSEFVAIVDSESRFRRLLHRQAIIERLSRDAAEKEAP